MFTMITAKDVYHYSDCYKIASWFRLASVLLRNQLAFLEIDHLTFQVNSMKLILKMKQEGHDGPDCSPELS